MPLPFRTLVPARSAHEAPEAVAARKQAAADEAAREMAKQRAAAEAAAVQKAQAEEEAAAAKAAKAAAAAAKRPARHAEHIVVHSPAKGLRAYLRDASKFLRSRPTPRQP